MRIALAKYSLREVVEVFTFAFLLVIPILIIAHPFSAQAQPPNCGDGVVDIDEECDDSNMAPGDGCSDFCTIEEGYFCDNDMPPSTCSLGCEITVEKVGIPAYGTDVDMLRLTLSFLPPVFDTFDLNDPSKPEEVFKVPALSGTFIAEIPPNGWQLNSIDCGPEDILDIPDMADPIPPEFEDEFEDVDLGNLVFAVCLISGSATCTYTNTPIPGEDCNINVEVESLNGGDDTFPFNMSAGSLNDNFELNVEQTMSFNDMPFSTQYTITETVPENWILQNIVCEGDADFYQDHNNDSVEITCNSTGDVNCVFNNRRIPQPPPPAPIPTLSEWGLIAMAGALGLIGYMVIRRRKVSA